VRELPTPSSNFRAAHDFDDWLKTRNVTGISGVDTRAITRHIRKVGAPNVAIVYAEDAAKLNLEAAKKELAKLPSMDGMELACGVSTGKRYEWDQTRWKLGSGYGVLDKPARHVVAFDFGEKLNILRNLASYGCRVTIMPAATSAKDILALKPDGVFLSNGPGDPAATGQHVLPALRELIDSGVPVFGICLGHQLLGLAMGAKTEKMHQGHRGANHPVKNLATGKVEITAQNHGFVVAKASLPKELEITHVSLFDGTIAGMKHKTRPVFSVQYHPESSPGPHDSRYLFEQFASMMDKKHAA
jgi:carbamoyl-phosphate synthase small subunit